MVRSRQGGNVPLAALCPKQLFPSEQIVSGRSARRFSLPVQAPTGDYRRRLIPYQQNTILPTPACPSPLVSLSPAITLQCFKKQLEYVTLVKPELLPSAAPSARDFFLNGKDQSLRLVQGSSTALLVWMRLCRVFLAQDLAEKDLQTVVTPCSSSQNPWLSTQIL